MVNHFILQGRLVADPELKTNANGKDYVPFTVAWSEKRKEHESRLFLSCIAWSGTARMICKYFVKGQQIIVSGKLTANDWEDDQGTKHRVGQLQVGRVDFAGSKPDGSARGPGYVPSETFVDVDIDDDDLPF